MLIPVVLSGGAGTRLWPVSREGQPKPFMRLPDDQTLLGRPSAYRRAPAGRRPIAHGDQPRPTSAPWTSSTRSRRRLARDIASWSRWAQHRSGDRRRRAGVQRASATRRIGDPSRRPPDPRRAGLRRGGRAGRGLAARAPGDLRRGPGRAETGFGYIELGDRLDDGLPGRALRRETRRGHRPSLPGKWQVPVERRHVLFQAATLVARAGAHAPAVLSAPAPPGRRRRPEDRPWHQRELAAEAFAERRTFPLTTR